MRVNECEVWITCEGQRLPEYDTQPEGDLGKTFTCFIPSKAGKEFIVEWQNSSANHLEFAVKLDGSGTGAKTSSPPHGKHAKKGIRISPTMMHPFQFSELVTTDADEALHEPANADLGTIRVRVNRVKLVPRSDTRPKSFTHTFRSVGAVHERSKKAGAHCVTLGQATETDLYQRSKWTTKVIEREKGPVVEFLFRYRPLALLQAQNIAPLPARSSGSSRGTGQDGQDDNARPIKRQRLEAAGSNNNGEVDVKPDVANLSDDDEGELTMLKGQLSQIMDRINRMEQKKKRPNNVVSPKVKKEEPRASSSRLGGGSGDVIDLTLSD